MEQRRIPVPQQTTEQLQQFDRSIQHWSGEKVKLDLQMKAMLENIEGLYQGRQNLLDKTLVDAGVDPARVLQMRPNMVEGKLELGVLLKPAAGPKITMPDGSDASAQVQGPAAPTAPSAPAPEPPANPPGE